MVKSKKKPKSSPATRSLGVGWWINLLPPSILSLITTLFYYPSLYYSFMFDDLPNITKSYEIRHFSPGKLFFANSRWLPRLLNQFTYRHWEFDPFAYRVIDLLIHLTIGLIIFTLMLLVCKKLKSAPILQQNPLLFSTLASGLFLLHPVQTQTVTYITQLRLEGLVVLFSFAVILSFFLAATTKWLWVKASLYTLSAVLISFAAGTKEIVIVLPMLLALFDWFLIAQGDWRSFAKRLPVHLILAVVFYKTHFSMTTPVAPTKALGLKISLPNNRGNILTPTSQEWITPLSYLKGQFRVILHYITMFFWPFNLSFDYGWKIPPSFWSMSCFFPFLTLLSLLFTGLVLFLKNQANLISFSMGWFFIAVLPRSTIVPSTEFVCDYKTYLGSFGILFFIAYGLTHLIFLIKESQWALPALSHNKHIGTFALPAVLCIGLGFATQQRNIVWSSRTLFWKDVIEKTEPHTSARAYNNYAVGLVDAGKKEEAITYYKKAIKVDETYAEPIINLALHYQIRKEYNKAFSLYQKAIKMKEAHPEMYNNLGLLHLHQKAYDKAEKSFKTALKLRRHYSRALFSLGQTYAFQNKTKLAMEYYEKALQGDYQCLDFYYVYGSLCYKEKVYGKAIAALEITERMKKNHKNTRFMLATGYYYTGQHKRALPYYAALYRGKPNDPMRCYNYGQTLLHVGKYEKALEMFERCKGAQSRLPHTPLHIAKCLHGLGRTEQAKKGLAHFIQNTQVSVLKKMGTELLETIT